MLATPSARSFSSDSQTFCTSPYCSRLRRELRELPFDDAQMVRETAELLLDAVDLRAQRLLCVTVCCCDCGVHVFTVVCCRRVQSLLATVANARSDAFCRTASDSCP